MNEANTEIIKEQRLALSMAILSQVHLANIDFQMSMEEYLKEAIRKYESRCNLTLKKENIPIPTNVKPELDKTELLDVKQHSIYLDGGYPS